MDGFAHLEEVLTEDLAAEAIAVIEGVLREHVVAVAWSGGKDSTAVLILALVALRNLKARGATVAPLLVLHNDTEIENPAVRGLADEQLAKLAAWAEAEGLEVEIAVSTPALTDTWAVKVLGGRALPRWPGAGKGDCAMDYKRSPAGRASRRVFREMKERYRALAAVRGPDSPEAEILARIGRHATPVVLLGSRREESVARAASIAKHGQQAAGVTETRDEAGKTVSRTCSPIVDWTVRQVWELIAYAGTDGEDYPVWLDSRGFAELNDLYKDATGSCVIIPGPHQKQAAACGARFGCWACQKVAEDRSLNTMLLDDAYAHLRPLARIRDFVADIRWDMDRRHWIGRRVDPRTRHVLVGPDSLSDATLEEIALAVLSADRGEALRADAFARALERGQVPDDALLQDAARRGGLPPAKYVERMRTPRFRTLDARKLVALDFMWSLFGRHRRPFHALALADRVYGRGEAHRAPVVAAAARPTDMAVSRWVPLTFSPGSASGIGDPLALFAQESCFGSAESARLPESCGDALVPEHRMGTGFDVDEEGAELVLALEWSNGLDRRHADPSQSVTAAALYYLRMGIVQVSPHNQGHFHRILQRTEALERSGLLGLDRDDLLARSVSGEEHEALAALPLAA